METKFVYWYASHIAEWQVQTFETEAEAGDALQEWALCYPHNTYTLAKIIGVQERTTTVGPAPGYASHPPVTTWTHPGF